MLRSTLAQFEFSYQIRKYDEQGIPFRTHLYVPEVHPVTGTTFYEREYEAHVLVSGKQLLAPMSIPYK